jgi:hypothetical protein
MLTKWGPEFEDMASESLLERNGWLRRGALCRALADAKRLDLAPVQLWSALVLEQWMRRNTLHAAETRLESLAS